MSHRDVCVLYVVEDRHRISVHYISNWRTSECMDELQSAVLVVKCLSLWLIGTVRAEPETVISRAWVQSPDPAE